MRISWTENKTNEWVLEKMAVNVRLLTTLNRRKMSLIGHILRAIYLWESFIEREEEEGHKLDTATISKKLQLEEVL